MVDQMSDKELITITIDNYKNLQRIKKANGSQAGYLFYTTAVRESLTKTE